MSSSLQSTVTRHWNERARSYTRNHKQLFTDSEASQRWTRVLARFIAQGEALNILDAGCGPGTVTRSLVELGHKVTAVDVSTEMLDRAKGIVDASAGRVRFLQADVADLPFPDDHFDMVISRYVVWTLPDPSRAVREWRRILKPGGRLGIIDGNWYLHTTRNGPKKMLMSVSDLICKMRRGFDKSQKLATHYAADLPLTYIHRPDWDIGLLTGLGFDDIKTTKEMGELVKGTSWLRFFNMAARPFLVEGRKPTL